MRDRGSVTAEFATVIPAVIVVLAICLAAMQLVSRQVLLTGLAASASRAIARGEPASTASAALSGATTKVEHRGELVCVTASTVGVMFGSVIAAIPIAATSCTLDGGR